MSHIADSADESGPFRALTTFLVLASISAVVSLFIKEELKRLRPQVPAAASNELK